MPTSRKLRKQEFARPSGLDRTFIESQKYALLSHPQNLEGPARMNLKLPLSANRRLNTAYCKPENNVALGFVAGLNNKFRVMQRRAYGLRDEEYLRLKVLTSMLPQI